MKAAHPPVSACRYCQFYKPIGRRGGSCEMLGVSVQGVWKGCHLGITQFQPSGEEIKIYQEKSHTIEEKVGNQFQKVS